MHLPVKEPEYIQTAMDRDYWWSLRIQVSGHSFLYDSRIKSGLVFKADDGVDAIQELKSTMATSDNEEERIALMNSRETGDLGGTACRRMERQLSQ